MFKFAKIVMWYATERGKGRSILLPFCEQAPKLAVKRIYERKSIPRTVEQRKESRSDSIVGEGKSQMIVP